MTTIRLAVEASEANAVSMARIRGIKDAKVVSHNTRTNITVLSVEMAPNWDVIFAWWKSSEVAGLRRTLAGEEIVR